MPQDDCEVDKILSADRGRPRAPRRVSHGQSSSATASLCPAAPAPALREIRKRRC